MEREEFIEKAKEVKAYIKELSVDPEEISAEEVFALMELDAAIFNYKRRIPPKE